MKNKVAIKSWKVVKHIIEEYDVLADNKEDAKNKSLDPNRVTVKKITVRKAN